MAAGLFWGSSTTRLRVPAELNSAEKLVQIIHAAVLPVLGTLLTCCFFASLLAMFLAARRLTGAAKRDPCPTELCLGDLQFLRRTHSALSACLDRQTAEEKPEQNIRMGRGMLGRVACALPLPWSKMVASIKQV